ncbi:PREDICTED: cytochrome P450 94B1 [Tarenaya hassleriana]|uniref:cytochrome P450 94B1 n=1 Tax=Tarenaya hassleriana TaxID=28532 RepID=UPI00053C48CD|nr:PREDICTED: cytochrome P450 94B1 [Tarenaya hassleriana]
METLALLVILVVLFHVLRRSLIFPGWKSRNDLPKTYPIIGCLVSFYINRNRLLDWYTELLTKCPGRTVVIRRLGARRTIVTANPANVEYILRTNFDNFPKGKPFTEILGDFLGHGIFNVDGDLWMKQRRLATHDFTVVSLRDYVTVLRDEVHNRLLPFLDSVAEDSRPIDLQELLRRFTFNMVCMVFLGIARCSLDPSLPVSALDKAFQTASAISAKRGSEPLFFVWKVKRWVRIGSERKLRRAIEEVHSCVRDIIREKKTKITMSENPDFLARLILAGESEEMVRDMVISLIMAGRDTTSAAMTRLFWSITDRTEIERELVSEIMSVKDKTGDFDYESLRKLKFLKACLCEAMRLYPPVPWDSKHALTDDRLPDGTPVRAGDRVTYFPYGMGRMEDIWGKNWDEFKPNRWFTGKVLKKVSPYKFPVFQAGPRVCLGKEMAFLQMKYLVAEVLHRFEIIPAGFDKPVVVPMLTAHMAGGLKVFVRRRDRSRCRGVTGQCL